MPRLHLPERLLQLIWEKQYIRTERLVTTDGSVVRVYIPGRVSLDAGPDIRGARVQIDGTVYAGDIEIHRHAEEWDAHGHAADTRYNGVVLHVVLHTPPPTCTARTAHGRIVPCLALENVLSQPLDVLRKDAAMDDHDLMSGRLHCTGQNDHVQPHVLLALLNRLAAERLEVKLRRFEERLLELARTTNPSAREVPPEWEPAAGDPDEIPSPEDDARVAGVSRRDLWEQVLYEGIMEALGYSRNRRPFIRLSSAVTLDTVRGLAVDSLRTEALLLGASGLLPPLADAGDAEARTYLHILRSEWHELRRRYRSEILTAADWVLSPTRPFNAPLVRLVAARSIIRRIIDQDLFRTLVSTVRSGADSRRAVLHRLLAVKPGPFWERRVSFARVVPRSVQPLGEPRRDDIIVNVLVPLFLLYARMFRDARMREGVMTLMRDYPPSSSNTITRRMERHLFAPKVALDTALRQQAAIHLFHYYCSGARCAECEVGQLVWGNTGV